MVLGSCLRKRQLRSGFFLKMATYDAIKTVGLLTNEKISNIVDVIQREREKMKRFGANPLV